MFRLDRAFILLFCYWKENFIHTTDSAADRRCGGNFLSGLHNPDGGFHHFREKTQYEVARSNNNFRANNSALPTVEPRLLRRKLCEFAGRWRLAGKSAKNHNHAARQGKGRAEL